MGILQISLEDVLSCNRLWEFPIENFLVLARKDFPGLYILSPSARLIWDILKTGAPFAELVREFASTYDIPTDLAALDVTRTLDHWRLGLLAHQRNWFSRAAARAGYSSNSDVFAGDYCVLGKSVRVILQTSELAEEIVPRLESLPHAPSAPDFTFRVIEDADAFHVFAGECCVATEETAGATRAVLFQEIVRCCRGRDCLAVLHAGACGFNSRCVVFPGGTQSGKTTLAAVLMKTGLTFYSDDSVLLERDTLSVPAMPFALMVREGSWDLLYPRFPHLRDAPIVTRFGERVRFLPPAGTEGDDSCGYAAVIVFVRFRPGASNEINILDPLQTLLRLQQSGFWVAHDEESIRAFLIWIQSTISYEMTYSDVDQAARMTRRVLC